MVVTYYGSPEEGIDTQRKDTLRQVLHQDNTIFVPIPELDMNPQYDSIEYAVLIHQLHRVINKYILSHEQLNSPTAYSCYVSLHANTDGTRGSYMVVNDDSVSYLDANIGRLGNRKLLNKLSVICRDWDLSIRDVFPNLEIEKNLNPERSVFNTVQTSLYEVLQIENGKDREPHSYIALEENGKTFTLVENDKRLHIEMGAINDFLRQVTKGVPGYDTMFDEKGFTKSGAKYIQDIFYKSIKYLQKTGALKLRDVWKYGLHIDDMTQSAFEDAIDPSNPNTELSVYKIYEILHNMLFRKNKDQRFGDDVEQINGLIDDYDQLVASHMHVFDKDYSPPTLGKITVRSSVEDIQSMKEKIKSVDINTIHSDLIQKRSRLVNELEHHIIKKQKHRSIEAMIVTLKNFMIGVNYVNKTADVPMMQAVTDGIEEHIADWDQEKEQKTTARAKTVESMAVKAINRKDPNKYGKEGIYGLTDAVGVRTIVEVDNNTPKQERIDTIKNGMKQRLVSMIENPVSVKIEEKEYRIKPKRIIVSTKLDGFDFGGTTYENQKDLTNTIIQELNDIAQQHEIEVVDRNKCEGVAGSIGLDEETINRVEQEKLKSTIDLLQNGVVTGYNGGYKDMKRIVDYELIDREGSVYQNDKSYGGIEMQRYRSDHKNEVGLANHHFLDSNKFVNASIRNNSYVGLHFVQTVFSQGATNFVSEITKLIEKQKSGELSHYESQQLENLKYYQPHNINDDTTYDIVEIIQKADTTITLKELKEKIVWDMIYSQVDSGKMMFARYQHPNGKPTQLPGPKHDYDQFWQVINGGVGISLEPGMITSHLDIIMPCQEGDSCFEKPIQEEDFVSISKLSYPFRKAKQTKLWKIRKQDVKPEDDKKALLHVLQRNIT